MEPGTVTARTIRRGVRRKLALYSAGHLTRLPENRQQNFDELHAVAVDRTVDGLKSAFIFAVPEQSQGEAAKVQCKKWPVRESR